MFYKLNNKTIINIICVILLIILIAVLIICLLRNDKFKNSDINIAPSIKQKAPITYGYFYSATTNEEPLQYEYNYNKENTVGKLSALFSLYDKYLKNKKDNAYIIRSWVQYVLGKLESSTFTIIDNDDKIIFGGINDLDIELSGKPSVNYPVLAASGKFNGATNVQIIFNNPDNKQFQKERYITINF